MKIQNQFSNLPKAKYPFGERVLINRNIAGIVLYSYNMYNEKAKPHFIYRILVDAGELCYRVANKHIKQDPNDIILFREDFDNLISTTEKIAVIQVSEDKLSIFNEEITPLGESYEFQ